MSMLVADNGGLLQSSHSLEDESLWDVTRRRYLAMSLRLTSQMRMVSLTAGTESHNGCVGRAGRKTFPGSVPTPIGAQST